MEMKALIQEASHSGMHLFLTGVAGSIRGHFLLKFDLEVIDQRHKARDILALGNK